MMETLKVRKNVLEINLALLLFRWLLSRRFLFFFYTGSDLTDDVPATLTDFPRFILFPECIVNVPYYLVVSRTVIIFLH